jgi:hypothetical protein
MTTTTEEPKKLKITMSERPPVTIVKAEWPLIASATDHDGQVRCQANHEWDIRVREHADGRRLVYGWMQGGNGGMHAHEREVYAGFLVTGADETVRAIRRVAGVIEHDKLGDECIADLPAEEIPSNVVVVDVEALRQAAKTLRAHQDLVHDAMRAVRCARIAGMREVVEALDHITEHGFRSSETPGGS